MALRLLFRLSQQRPGTSHISGAVSSATVHNRSEPKSFADDSINNLPISDYMDRQIHIFCVVFPESRSMPTESSSLPSLTRLHGNSFRSVGWGAPSNHKLFIDPMKTSLQPTLPRGNNCHHNRGCINRNSNTSSRQGQTPTSNQKKEKRKKERKKETKLPSRGRFMEGTLTGEHLPGGVCPVRPYPYPLIWSRRQKRPSSLMSTTPLRGARSVRREPLQVLSHLLIHQFRTQHSRSLHLHGGTQPQCGHTGSRQPDRQARERANSKIC